MEHDAAVLQHQLRHYMLKLKDKSALVLVKTVKDNASTLKGKHFIRSRKIHMEHVIVIISGGRGWQRKTSGVSGMF